MRESATVATAERAGNDDAGREPDTGIHKVPSSLADAPRGTGEREAEERVFAPSVETLFAELSRFIESGAEGLRCAIWVVDPDSDRLVCRAAPSLPISFVEAIDRRTVEARNDFVVQSARTGKRTLIADVRFATGWDSLREIARSAGVSAIWSEPILSTGGELLGALTFYAGRSGWPDDRSAVLLRQGARLAGRLLDRHAADTLARNRHPS